MGEPQAMFSADLEGVSNYSFRQKEQDSEESFIFQGEPITIFQTGCETIRQEFHFTLEPVYNVQKSVENVSKRLIAFSHLGEKQVGFLNWAQALQGLLLDIKFGEAIQAAPGIQIMMDRIQQADKELILLRLEME